MLKIEKDYNEKYGNIPKDADGRLTYLKTERKINEKNEVGIESRINRFQKIGWKEIMFTIYLLPKATPRPRSTSRGSFFYVQGASDNKKYFHNYIKDMEYETIYTPCKFDVRTYFPIPASMNKEEAVVSELGYGFPTSKPDWDNVGKTYSDMIQDTIIADDSLIICGRSLKFYSVKPRIEIRVQYMEDYDLDYNRKKMERKIKKGGNHYES